MGSTRCRHFVQNAWKKDLCSNCFKSRDEHAAAAPARLQQRQAVTHTPLAPPPPGILKGVSWTRSKTHRVYFPAEESEVIGEGGEDAGPPSDEDSDDQADEDWTRAPVEDDPKEKEEERLLQALTRSNTDFNSVSANLEGTSAPAPTPSPAKQAKQAQLQLGRTQTDSSGRKQTLLVSVQPFGKPSSTSSSTPANTSSSTSTTAEHVTKIPVATPATAPTSNGVVLKSIIHTGELPPVKTPVSNTKVPSSCEASPPAAPAPTTTLLKLNDAQVPADKTVSAPLSSKHMFLKSIVEPAVDAVTISNGVSSPSTPTSPSKTAPTTTVPAKTTASLASSLTATAVSSTKSEAKPVKSLSSTASVKAASNTSTTEVTSSTGTSSRREGKRTHITRGTPISKNNELLLKTKFIPLRTSTILNNNTNGHSNNNSNNNSNNVNNKRNALGQKEEVSPSLVKINGVRSEPVMLIEAKELDSSDEDDDLDQRTYSNVQSSQPKRLDDSDAASTQTKRLASLLAPLSVGVHSVVGSREQAGEPDGRADPDSSSESGSEPPALPQSPPPAVDPRPSFLHGLTARLANATSTTTTFDKPRVPYKSSTVVQAATANSASTTQQQRWSQVSAQLQQQHQQQQAKAAASAVEPPQAPSCSPPSSPEGSPVATPHGTPPSEACSRAQKRQAPQPPQEQQHSPSSYTSASPLPSPSPSPSSSPVKETAPTLRAALGRSASTGSSSSCSSPAPSPGASPPSPVMSTPRKSSLSQVQSQSAHKDSRRRSSQHLLMMAPLPPLAPSRSESVPSGLSQVALGHSVTLGAHSGHSIAQALAQANSFVSMSPSAGQQTSPGPGQPQPSPRRALSLSTDSLTGTTPTKHVLSYDTERKKPGTKVRFSLRKFLGLTKDGSGVRGDVAGSGADGGVSMTGTSTDPLSPPQPRPRPRLEIIHPSDLSGRAVEVLRASGVEVRRQLLEQAAQAQASAQAQLAASTATPVPLPLRDLRRNSDSASTHGDTTSDHGSDSTVKTRPNKPPPPPRSQSLEHDPHSQGCPSPSTRPSRPPPPKSAHVDLLMRRHSSTSPTASTTTSPTSPPHSVYANVSCVAGEMRPCVAPLKPQRTGSVRDSAAEGPRRTPLVEAAKTAKHQDGDKDKEPPKMPVRTCSLSSQPEDSGYESVELSDSAQPQSMTDSENVYECVNGTGERSSSPECDSASKRASPSGGGTRSGSGGVAQVGSGPASVSAHYCGSETESDIYSPYSFYGSDEGDDQDGEAEVKYRGSGRVRKGRSVVHKSMEENYDAVVGANLEALAQLLEQIRTGPTVPAPLRPLKTATDLTWVDFSGVSDDEDAVTAGRWAFLPALWGCHAVTLAVLPDHAKGAKGAKTPSMSPFPSAFALLPIAEFADRVPCGALPVAARPAACANHVQALVAVLTRVRVDSLSSYGSWLEARHDNGGHAGEEVERAEAAWREAGLALLQLLNALLTAQTLRLDEAVDPDSVVFLRDPAQPHATPQLAMLGLHDAAVVLSKNSAAQGASLCRCALAGVRALLQGSPATPLLTSILEEAKHDDAKESKDALTRAKAVLEYWLWGPVEAAPSTAALQRWLDLERATVLHRLVCARAAAGPSPSQRLAIHQQSHLLFLVQTSATAMCDASQLLDAARVAPLEATS